MLLSDTQITAVEQQTGAKPIPAEDPSAAQLNEAFGSHTFYADPNGLHVIEALPEDMDGVEAGMAAIVQVAEWQDENKTSLVAIEPKALGAVVNLDAAATAEATSDEGSA